MFFIGAVIGEGSYRLSVNKSDDLKSYTVHQKKGQIDHASDVLVDRLFAIDNKRLIKKSARIPENRQIN